MLTLHPPTHPHVTVTKTQETLHILEHKYINFNLRKIQNETMYKLCTNPFYKTRELSLVVTDDRVG